MKLYKIKTTALTDDDILLVTTLTEEQIVEVITPIVQAERDGYQQYTNLTLMDALCKTYPSESIELYFEPNTITI